MSFLRQSYFFLKKKTFSKLEDTHRKAYIRKHTQFFKTEYTKGTSTQKKQNTTSTPDFPSCPLPERKKGKKWFRNEFNNGTFKDLEGYIIVD